MKFAVQVVTPSLRTYYSRTALGLCSIICSERLFSLNCRLGMKLPIHPNDAWLLALADKSKSHYFVTGDKRAGVLSLIAVGQTQIVTAAVFCEKVL